MKYTKITNDLKLSDELASKAIEGCDDGGSANLDFVLLKLPYLREAKVVEAITNAGLYCFGKSDFGYLGTGYSITPNGVGQGNTRSIGVEVMCDSLKELGYDATIVYIAD